MVQSISKPPTPTFSASVMDVVAPFSAQSLFWRPRFLKSSPSLWHVPFLFWVVEVMRPTCVVQLGTGHGAGYFALCQGLEKLGHDVRSYGASGYDASPAETAVLQDIEKHNESHYGDFSCLVPGDPGALRRQLKKGTIDLLVVDGPLSDRGLEVLETKWLPMMANDGVLVLHGLRRQFSSPAGQALIERLTQEWPTIELDGGDGLLAVLCGKDAPEPLQRMASLHPGDEGFGDIHRVFSRLGAVLHQEGKTLGLSDEIEATLAQCDVLQRDLLVARQRSDHQNEDLERLQALMAERVHERDTARADLDAAGVRQAEVGARHQADQEALRRELDELKVAQVSAVETLLEETEAQAGQVLRELTGRCEAVASRGEELRRELGRARWQISRRFEELALMTQELEGCRTMTEALRQELAGMRASTSWKMTRPVRFLRRVALGRVRKDGAAK